MNIISVIFLLVFSTLFPKEPFLVIEGKSITVTGNTSLGGFTCDYTIAEKSDTLFIAQLPFSPYNFSIPVKEFQCGNFLLNRDFQHTLKEKEFPQVSVQVLNLVQTGDKSYTGTIMLSLVGKYKKFKNVDFFILSDKNKLSLNASFVVLASEFALKPPSKLGGMIKADDALDIKVSLLLQQDLAKCENR